MNFSISSFSSSFAVCSSLLSRFICLTSLFSLCNVPRMLSLVNLVCVLRIVDGFSVFSASMRSSIDSFSCDMSSNICVGPVDLNL